MNTELVRILFSEEKVGYVGSLKPRDLPMLHCPVCDYNYVSFGIAENHNGGEAQMIRDMGVRGDIVVLPFSCELGHTWELVLGFHKGQTFYDIQLGVTLTEKEDK